MRVIFEQTEVPHGYNKLSYAWDDVVGKDGKVYTPFCYQDYVEGYGAYVYRIALPYTGDRIINPTLDAMGYLPFKTQQILKNRDSGTIVSTTIGTANVTARGGETGYDADKKIGFYCPIDFTNYTSSASDFRVIAGYKYKYHIPYVGIFGDASFWDNVENLPKPSFPFELDSSTEGGGDGEWDDNTSDTISLPDIAQLNLNSISNTRFFSCYKMSPEQLSSLADELWSTNFFTQLSNTVLKPTDFIVSLNMIPIDVPSTSKLIKAGTILLNGAVGGLINTQFVRVDCGTLNIKKKWGGAIDYQTDVSCFLPFIGEVTLNPNEVIGATIGVIYTVDIMSGNCIASIKVKRDALDAILYQYNGNVASPYAITSQDYSAVFGGLLQLSVGVAGSGLNATASTIATVGATSNLLSGARVQRTGNVSASSGFMGIKKPYIILSRPIQSMPESYNQYRGYVSNITLSLSECRGFTQIAEIHLENISATSQELEELDSLLKSGVIF